MDKRKEENIRVKKAITDALFRLMPQKNFADISITEIIREAGVARISYYRNYSSKTDILITLVQDIIREYVSSPGYDPKNLTGRKNVLLAFRTYRRYRRYVLQLHASEVTDIIAEQLVRVWRESPEYRKLNSRQRYRLAILSGALSAAAVEWLVNDMPEKPEEMADIFLECFGQPL